MAELEGFKEIKFLVRIQVLKHRHQLQQLFSQLKRSSSFSSSSFNSIVNTPKFGATPIQKEDLLHQKTKEIQSKVQKTIKMFELTTPSYNLQARTAANSLNENFENLAEQIAEGAWLNISNVLNGFQPYQSVESHTSATPDPSNPPSSRLRLNHQSRDSYGSKLIVPSMGYRTHKGLTRIASEKLLTRLEKQNEVLKEKMQKVQHTMETMRDKYFKEISNLREISFQTGRGRKEYVQFLNVHFFDLTDGLDSKTLDALNERLHVMKRQFQISLNDLRSCNQDMMEKVALYQEMIPEGFPLLDMPMAEIFSQIALIERDPLIIWDAIEKAYHKGFFLEIIEKNFEKIMSAQGVDPNKLQVELDALREDFQEKWKRMKQQYEEEVFAARREAREKEEQAKEAQRVLSTQVQKAMNSCFEMVNIEISDLNKTVDRYESIDPEDLKGEGRLIILYKELRAKYRLFRLEYLKMRENSRQVQEDKEKKEKELETVHKRIKDCQEKYRACFNENDTLNKMNEELRALADTLKFQNDKLEVQIHRMVPDRKKRHNAKLLIINRKRESSDSRLSSQRVLYSSRISNRDTITQIQGIDTILYDEEFVEKEKLRLLEEKHPEEQKVETNEVEIQTDYMTQEMPVMDNQMSIEIEPSDKSERVPTQMSERGKTESVGKPASSVKMTKSVSHRSIASKAAVILKETGVQTEAVQFLPQELKLEEVLEFKEMRGKRQSSSPTKISPIPGKQVSRKESSPSSSAKIVPDTNLEQIHQRVSQEAAPTISPSRTTSMKEAPSIQKNLQFQKSQEQNQEPDPVEAQEISRQRVTSQGQAFSTPTPQEVSQRSVLRAQELPRVKVNQSRGKYYQASQEDVSARPPEDDISSHENGIAQMSEREIHFLQEKGYTFTRRKTVDLVGQQGTLLKRNVDGYIWEQRRQTSNIILMKDVPSRKTLTTTEQSKKQLQEIVIPDPNEGLDLDQYNKALKYISSSHSKRREIHSLAELERRKNLEGSNVAPVYSRLYRDAEEQRERKQIFTQFVEQERAREWNEVRNYLSFNPDISVNEKSQDQMIQQFSPLNRTHHGLFLKSGRDRYSRGYSEHQHSRYHVNMPSPSSDKTAIILQDTSNYSIGIRSLESTQTNLHSRKLLSHNIPAGLSSKLGSKTTLLESNESFLQQSFESPKEWTPLGPGKAQATSRSSKQKRRYVLSRTNRVPPSIGPPACNLSNHKIGSGVAQIRMANSKLMETTIFSNSFKDHPLLMEDVMRQSTSSRLTSASYKRDLSKKQAMFNATVRVRNSATFKRQKEPGAIPPPHHVPRLHYPLKLRKNQRRYKDLESPSTLAQNETMRVQLNTVNRRGGSDIISPHDTKQSGSIAYQTTTSNESEERRNREDQRPTPPTITFEAKS